MDESQTKPLMPLSSVPELTGPENWIQFRRKIEEYFILADQWDEVKETKPPGVSRISDAR
ncbi:MAG: hypothetical protein MMC33_010825, partial [Icmadophila ericetorum]|nr:hypothetical protein [Icmadophila ericetorum]